VKNLLAALLLACSLFAQAEPVAEKRDKCVIEMTQPLSDLWTKYARGDHPALLSNLARHDRTFGGAGRWLLVEAIPLLAHAETKQDFLAAALAICEEEQHSLPLPERRLCGLTPESQEI
jgi:hypothetical protein